MGKKENGNELTFEQALARLEELVTSMEEGEIPLAELVNKFEEGDKLLQHCAQQLQQAGMKIQKLKMTKNMPALEEMEDPDTD